MPFREPVSVYWENHMETGFKGLMSAMMTTYVGTIWIQKRKSSKSDIEHENRINFCIYLFWKWLNEKEIVEKVYKLKINLVHGDWLLKHVI
jgi:hypothetical protein